MNAVEIPSPYCDPTFFPTKAQLMGVFAEIASIPARLNAEIARLKTQIESYDIEGQIKAEVQKQIDSLVANVKKIKEYLDTIEETIDNFLASMTKPVYPNLRAKILEWERRITAMTQEFHLYIQTEILKLISSVIPISFTVNVFGLSIDLEKLFSDPNYKLQLKQQIRENVDDFYALVEEQYKTFTGYFGFDSADIKVEIIWSNIIAKLQRGALELLWNAFGSLIDTFKSIWDSLHLPSLPSLTDLNVKTLVENAIDDLKQKIIGEVAEIKQMAKEKVAYVKQLVSQTSSQSREEIEKYIKTIEDEIERKVKLVKGYMKDVESALKALSLSAGGYSFDILGMIGGEIEDRITSIERRIDRYVEALRDFGESIPKKILFDWVEDVMQFFNEIGLGSILDKVLFTFCDFMELIGVPLSINIDSDYIKVV